MRDLSSRETSRLVFFCKLTFPAGVLSCCELPLLLLDDGGNLRGEGVERMRVEINRRWWWWLGRSGDALA